MRSDPASYELVAPPSLKDLLVKIAGEPGHVLIAGGTELMVAYNTGRLSSRSLLSIQHLPELRFIRCDETAVHIGSGSTFTDIRRSSTIAQELSLLVQAASWTGSIANQNRATLGGNICNGSPAADTPPALLAYDASVTMISIRGERTIPYRDFHLGYKRTVLEPDEMLYSVSVPRAYQGWRQYIRKVGTRNAQAISKTAIACIARVDGGRIEDIRLGAASIADRPLRCVMTEAALRGHSLSPSSLESTIRGARVALTKEARPIDDIRSTAMYRSAVAANLLEEFVRSLAS